MSKNKDISSHEIEIPKKGTLLERFNAYLKTHQKKNEIIDFIDAINAQYIERVNNGLSTQDKKEILEFCEYFNDNYTLDLFEELYCERPDEPFILWLGEQLEHEAHKTERKKRILNANPKDLREAKSLSDIIFKIHDDRIITGLINYEDAYERLRLEIPRTIREDELADTKEELLDVCLQIIEGKGYVVVRLMKDLSTYEVFGIIVSNNGSWIPISKEDMQKISSVITDGIELDPEDKVTYTEIKRNRI